jgi:hypothetical protein
MTIQDIETTDGIRRRGALLITGRDEVDRYVSALRRANERTVAAIRAIECPQEAMRRLKFEAVGFHPVEDRPLNAIEQINQTFTYLVALKATEWLLERHPEAGGFMVAPGADASQRLDIMSVEPDLVGAETFAAVDPRNNRKIHKDLAKLAIDPSRFRYSFFYAPGFAPGRVPSLERGDGVEVHCLEI